MSISIVSYTRSLKVRAYSIYRASRLIIEYSDEDSSLSITTKKSLTYLNNIIKGFWDEKQPTEIMLENLCIQMMSVIKLFYESINLKYNQNEIKDHLNQADHIYNWLFRNKNDIDDSFMVIKNDNDDTGEQNKSTTYLHTTKYQSISHANKSISNEWMKIASESPPKWFTTLPTWQKNIYLDFFEIWVYRELIYFSTEMSPSSFKKLPEETKEKYLLKIKHELNDKKSPEVDFIEFLGMQTGYLPNYPSTRNAYRVINCLYKKSNIKNSKLSLVRKASIIRSALPIVFCKDENETVRLTIANIKQTILVDIIAPYRRAARFHSKTKPVKVPVLIQSLISNHRVHDNEEVRSVLYNAIDSLREEFSSQDKACDFLQDNKGQLIDIVKNDTLIKDPEEFIDDIIRRQSFQLSICFISHDVFKKSFWSQIKNSMSRERKEYDYLIEVVDFELCRQISKSLFIEGVPLAKSKYYEGKIKTLLTTRRPLITINELNKLDIKNIKYKIPALKLALDSYKMFLSSPDIAFTKAAYLLITFSSIGLRIGGCSNGCDFEGPLSVLVNSLRIFYAKYSYFPDHPLATEEQKSIYHELIAHQFLKGSCQNILEYSSEGSSGLTHLESTLGPEVKKKIEEISLEYGFSEESDDIYKTSAEISKIEVIAECFNTCDFDTSFEEQYKKIKAEDKSLEAVDSIKQYETIDIPDSIKDKTDSRVYAEVRHRISLFKDMSSYFNIKNKYQLIKEINYASKTQPAETSLNKLSRFRDNFVKNISKNPKDKI